jgi:hypothetical protein
MHQTRPTLFLAVALCGVLCAGIVTPAAAQHGAAAEHVAEAGHAAAADRTKTATSSDDVSTGSIVDSAAEQKAKRERQFDDCIAMWDAGTHMTKKQWRRTCQRQLDDMPGP